MHIPSEDIYISKRLFLPIIQFWELQWLLYFNEYHVEKELRTIPDIKGYYYVAPAKDEPSDLEKVQIILSQK